MLHCLIYLWVGINAVSGNSITANIVYSWSRPSREQGGEGRQTGYVVVLWASSRKGNSPERPAWEWVSISDSISRAPTLFPSPSPSLPSPPPAPPVHSNFSLYLPLYSSPSRGGVKKSFLMGFSQIVFTDISEIFRCKENIWTYFSLIGSLMAMCCAPVLSTQAVALRVQNPA